MHQQKHQQRICNEFVQHLSESRCWCSGVFQYIRKPLLVFRVFQYIQLHFHQQQRRIRRDQKLLVPVHHHLNASAKTPTTDLQKVVGAGASASECISKTPTTDLQKVVGAGASPSECISKNTNSGFATDLCNTLLFPSL